jgi:hypothetical protein
MTALSPRPTATITPAPRPEPAVDRAGSSRCHTGFPPDTAGPIHDIDLDDPWIRQVLHQCLQELSGCPAPALPELAFRLLQQRLLQGLLYRHYRQICDCL